MPLPDNPSERLFGRISQVVKSDSGLKTIEIRVAVLNAIECDQINWQPFAICHYLHDDNFWNPIAPTTPDLPRYDNGEQLPADSKITDQQYSWIHFASLAEDLLRRTLESGSVASRKVTNFVAPDTKTTPATINITVLSGSEISKKKRPQKAASKAAPLNSKKTIIKVVVLIFMLAFAGILIRNGHLKSELRSKGETIIDLRDELQSTEIELVQVEKDRNSIGESKSLQLENLKVFRQDLSELFSNIHKGQSLISKEDQKFILSMLKTEDDPKSLNNSLQRWKELEKKIRTDVERSEEKANANSKLLVSLKKIESSLASLERSARSLKTSMNLPNSKKIKLQSGIEETLEKLDSMLKKINQEINNSRDLLDN